MMLPARDISRMLPTCSSLQKSYYKILTLEESERFCKEKVFSGSDVDRKEKSIFLFNSLEQCFKEDFQEMHLYEFKFKRRVNIFSERHLDNNRCLYLINDILKYEDIYTIRVI